MDVQTRERRTPPPPQLRTFSMPVVGQRGLWSRGGVGGGSGVAAADHSCVSDQGLLV